MVFFRVLTVVVALLFWGESSFAEGSATHSVYRVTSYNLGAIFSDQQSPSVTSSGSFQPLMITSSAADILNSEHKGSVSWVEITPHTTHASGMALAAEFAATSNLSVLGAFGVTRNLWAPDDADYQSQSSWEANLGIVYRFLDNLAVELHFGYMDTGDLFTDQSSYSGVEDIIMVSNTISMSF